MSFPTKPAFVHYGTWDDETRAHPCMKWMEQYTLTYDSKAPDKVNNFMTDDHLLIRTTGQKHTGAQASVEALYNDIYAPFAKWAHIPYHMITYEIEDGWEMMGLATLYWKLAVPGKTEDSGSKVKDKEGNEWDGANHAAYNFRYKKVGDEIRLAKTEIAADPTAVTVEMLKRGMMKPEDLLK